MARTRQQRPSKPRRVPKKILHIPPEVSNTPTSYHKTFHSCPSQLIQNGLRFDRPSTVIASTRRTVKRTTGKRPTRKTGKQDCLLVNTSEGASATTSDQGSHSMATSMYMTPQQIPSYNSAISPPVVSPGFDLPSSQFQAIYQHEAPSSWPAKHFPHPDDLWPSSSVDPYPASLQIVPTILNQVPNFILQDHALGDGSYYAVQEQSPNQVPPTAGSPLTEWPELWNGDPSVSMPVEAYAYSHPQEVLMSDLAMTSASDVFGGTYPPFQTNNLTYHPQ